MSIKMQLVVLALLTYVLCCGVDASKQKTKSVTTLIEAKWEVTPLVLEISEYLGDENADFLWEFLDAISALHPSLAELESDRERYEKALDVAGQLRTPAQISVLKLALSLHIYSPKVEMYSQMAIERGVAALGCPIAADVGGKLTCCVEELKKFITQTQGTDFSRVETFGLDHHYPGSQNNSITVVLYGELGTPEFAEFHHILKTYAVKGDIDYVLRHYVKERPNKRVRLSGYGVELQIKSTEYKVQDDTQVKGDKTQDSSEQDDEDDEIEGFNFSRLKQLYPDKKGDLDKLRLHLLESSNEMAPLKVWQVQELSLQAAERIMSSPKEEALKVLTNIAQNFPLQARSLVRTVVKDELKQEIKRNQEMFSSSLNLQPTDTALFVNGMFFDLDVVDVISLLEVVRQELRVMEGLHKIGISDSHMSSLLALDFSSGSGSSSSPEYAIDIRDSAVMWVNDIEHDKQYRRWSDSLMELLRPTFPGMLRSVRRNLYNLVILANPAKKEARPLLKLAESFYVHTAPLRIGLVFAVNSDQSVSGKMDAGVAMLNAFNYVSDVKDAYHGLAFITDVYATIKEDRDVTVEDVMSLLNVKYRSADVEEIFGEDSEYDTGRRLARDFVERSGFRKMPQALLNGIPISEKHLNGEDFEEAVLSEIMNQTPVFQKAVYKGDFTDGDNALDYIMNQPNVMPRLNDRVLNQDKSQYLDMSGSALSEEIPLTLKSFSNLSPRDKTATVISRGVQYFMKKQQSESTPHIVTHWIVTDLGTAEGRQLLTHALDQMRSSGSIRVGVLLNPSSTGNFQQLDRYILAAPKVLQPGHANQFMNKILSDDNLVNAINSEGGKDPKEIYMSGVDLTGLSEALQEDMSEILRIQQTYCQQVLNIPPGGRAIVTNGRVLGPLEDSEKFTLDDFSLLERYSMNSYGDKILQTLKKKRLDDDDDDSDEALKNSDVLMQAMALVVSRPQSRSRFEIPVHSDIHSVVKLPPHNISEPAFDIAVIVDPVSRGAQRVGPILSVLQEVLNCHIKVYLNCVEKNSDMPLKSFYRFVLEPEIHFTSDGRQTSGPMARFANMPTSPLLTQNMQVPENWLVESVRSPYDLDNIRLEDVDSVVHSEFELEYLLLEGHCFEATMGNPPRGLQITLGTETQPVVVDTIVMANLGYFQLKANPGAWLLRLRQGRSADIFDIVSHDGSDTPANSTDIKVLISSFRSHVLKLKVAKKPDKMHMDLLSDDSDPNSGIWNSITSTFGGSKTNEEDGEEKLNIFSLASGHLYERFLRIMMLSVLKNTNTPVKFWFLKNYLSPTFKDFLPHMAKDYGFEYELVQYKWPRWLHQQTEKQRIIWGYKILFLDVLFPLDVKKIIFVDADQVVRADMKELRDLDLGGAPYGYTPFCDSRTEMDGFRFWKQGYWRNHLQGRRYHISALYIVDLRRFRRIAAGDRLRGQYQALSQDPNSLSNLDQDLPNNMIHQVAIKSLPQEWLWCETWCDDASKQYAKTIDLCNNPLTKEAKLTAAMRIVSEWKDYDLEIKNLQNKIDRNEIREESSSKQERNAEWKADDHEVHSEL
ncbi:UDP-glucose:glycoprotein glucosyltransferase isoform X2 [Periplaneta americana]|uniref:UDP-glucose:glycoprotein glucosyltransferase isoform X2 n=1 Tax=Periplaneta americana TaxID=6978 RepID=UPI0037E8BD83